MKISPFREFWPVVSSFRQNNDANSAIHRLENLAFFLFGMPSGRENRPRLPARMAGVPPITIVISRKHRRGLPLRYAPVVLPGQTFVLALEQLRSRAGFVRTGAPAPPIQTNELRSFHHAN
jgi:hypothetical protein